MIVSKVRKAKRMLIVGDSGRGKTTFAMKLSEKLGIEYYSTDDFFWKVKFTEKEDKEKSVRKIERLYGNKKWIVEGSTRHLIKKGIEKADVIVYLGYRTIFVQFWVLFKRSLQREEERLIDLLGLYRHLFMKRYGLGSQKGKMSVEESISIHEDKVVRLYSFSEIDGLLEKL